MTDIEDDLRRYYRCWPEDREAQHRLRLAITSAATRPAVSDASELVAPIKPATSPVSPMSQSTPAASAQPRRSRIVVAPLAAAVVVAGVVAATMTLRDSSPAARSTGAGTAAVDRSATTSDSAQSTAATSPTSTRITDAPTHPIPGVAGHNRTLAVAAASNAFDHFPVPPGSTRTSTDPHNLAILRHVGAHVGAVDPTLTRTGWWLVPLRYDELVAWYVRHTPIDPRTTYAPDASTPSPEAVFFWTTTDTSAAYSAPVDIVAYSRLGPHLTAIRTDVTLAGRADRTAQTLVPTTMVTSIDITRYSYDGKRHEPSSVTVTDPDRIHAIAATFDGLPGGESTDGFHPCGSPVGDAYRYGLTFRWPGHSLVVDPGEPLCGKDRGLTRDGHAVPQTLQDDSTFVTELQHSFPSR